MDDLSSVPDLTAAVDGKVDAEVMCRGVAVETFDSLAIETTVFDLQPRLARTTHCAGQYLPDKSVFYRNSLRRRRPECGRNMGSGKTVGTDASGVELSFAPYRHVRYPRAFRRGMRHPSRGTYDQSTVKGAGSLFPMGEVGEDVVWGRER